jgi:hypothetical protein
MPMVLILASIDMFDAVMLLPGLSVRMSVGNVNCLKHILVSCLQN